MEEPQVQIVSKSRQEKEAMPKFAIRYTVDGEVLARNVNGNYIDDPLKTVDLSITPSFITEKHIEAMAKFYRLLLSLKQNQPDREIPLTRKEVFGHGFSKGVLRALFDAALLKETVIPIWKRATGKMSGSRSVIYFTPQGRAFIRAHVDPEYAVTTNT